MIVNHRYKFIFIKTRKTAGTSIEIGLSKICDEADIVTELGEPIENKIKFGYTGSRNFKIPFRNCNPRDFLKIPRDEWPKFHSHSPAWYVKQRIDPEIWNSYFKFCFERNPFDRIISQYFWNTREKDIGLEEYISSAENFRLSNWHMYTVDDQVVVDHVARFENLNEELDYIRCLLYTSDAADE